ncbi:unnamed protein product [Closterium sp. NIES-53]
MDFEGPATISEPRGERYFLVVMGDFSRYNTVLPLQQKADMLDALLPWLVAVRTQRARSVLRLHSDHGGKFTSGRLEKLCRAEGIRQMYLLLGSPQQNGVAERCVDLVMEITRTSMRRASIPHFRWPFVVYYGTRQLDLWPRVSCPHVLLTLHLGPLVLRLHFASEAALLTFAILARTSSQPTLSSVSSSVSP